MSPTTTPRAPDVPAADSSRAAVRRFDPDRPLPDGVLAGLLDLARFAPGAEHHQPWRFLVVRGEANRRRLRACAYRHPLLADAPAVVVVLGDLFPERALRWRAVDPSPAASETRARAASALARVTDRVLWATRAAATAAAALTAAARSAGIDSALLDGFDAPRLALAFGVPDDHAIVALVPLGYALEWQPAPTPLPLDDLCHREHFGQPWA